MIDSITATNFKLFKEPTEFSLSKVTLLTGINGRGKSSFLQVLLLLKQSFDVEPAHSRRIVLNGHCVQLGNYSALRNHSVTQSASIQLSFRIANNNACTINLIPDRSDDMIANADNNIPEDLRKKLSQTHYVAADRIGPQLFYKRLTNPSFATVGSRGENVGSVLFQQKDRLVAEALYRTKSKSQELLIQLGEWIAYILEADGLKVNVKDVGNGVILLSFQLGNNDADLMPTNVGFGYTYILPIVLSGLIANQGEILIIENPEAHLHPKAQSRLVEFLSLVASTEVQLMIESHSEHILNALRIQIANPKASLLNDDVSVLYFHLDRANDQAVTPVPIEPDGSIETWPENFFDQNRKDLKVLLGM